MTRGDDLYRLQQLDSESDARQDRLMEIETALQDDSVVREAHRALQRAEKRALTWQIRQRDLELEIESLSNKASRSERRLYSGKVKNPKELSDIQAEVASLKRRRRRLEDTLLEAMIEREEAQEALGEAGAHLEEIKTTWSVQKAELKAEREELKKRLEGIRTARETLAPRIEADVLAIYEGLREGKGGQAVARVEDDTCTGCGVTISPSAEWKLRQGELIHCDTCRRIMVMV